MEQMLTRQDLTELGVAAFEDGLTTHDQEVSSVVQLLDAAVPGDDLVAVVANSDCPEIVRLRALAHVATDWPRYAEPLQERATQDFDGAFAELLEAWRSHQDLRASGGSVGELFASRMILDRLRERVHGLRSTLDA